MSLLKIRKFQLNDQEAVMKLHKRALEGTGADLNDDTWDDDLKDISNAYVGGIFLIGTVDNTIVAMGAIKRDQNTGQYQVKRMRIDQAYRRQGFGQAILLELEKYARTIGVKELYLDTTVCQTSAQKLYEKNGFKELSRGNIYDLPSIYYRKQL